MKEKLCLTPVKADAQTLRELEEKGLIIRLAPSREEHRLQVPEGIGKGELLYSSDVRYGGHALMTVSIDNRTFSSFATHPENEEFLLLGGKGEKGLYLLVSYLSREELLHKIEGRSLRAEDFILLELTFNDPESSFFVMRAGVPHGECAFGEGKPSTFYVTEGAGLPLDKIPLTDSYVLEIASAKERF